MTAVITSGFFSSFRPSRAGSRLALALLAIAIWPAGAAGQAAMGDLLGGDSNSPIQIDAPGGIEWQQDKQVFIATGGATATRGTTVLTGDELHAFYRDSETGSSEIWRLDAVGHVRITAPGWNAVGGKAVYDVPQAVIVLSEADPVALTSGDDRVTASGQIEFWRAKGIAVARGNAQATRADRQIQADVLTATFEAGPDGKDRIRLVEGFDHVVIITANERVEANRAAYNVISGLARLDGNVTIHQGENRLSGCSADFDLNTSLSRLKSCPGEPGGERQRVKGILMPGAKSVLPGS